MNKSGLYRDAVLVWSLRACAIVAGAVVALIFAFLLVESMPALLHVGPLRLLGDASWHPAPRAAEGHFNLVPMIVGTLTVSAGAVALGAPLGVGSALFCQFYAPPMIARPFRRILELLAGIPSVVSGLWGLLVLVPLVAAWAPPGMSLFTGAVVLSIMVLPTMALIAGAAFQGAAAEHLPAAAALGLSRWTTIRRVVFPAARGSLATGLLLQSGRALGETMAVLMVCGNAVRIPGGPFDSVRTLTANIALEAEYAMGDHRSALFASGLVLLLLIIVLVVAAEMFAKGHVYGHAK